MQKIKKRRGGAVFMSKYSQETKDQALNLFKIGFGIQSVVNNLNISRHIIKIGYSNIRVVVLYLEK